MYRAMKQLQKEQEILRQEADKKEAKKDENVIDADYEVMD